MRNCGRRGKASKPAAGRTILCCLNAGVHAAAMKAYEGCTSNKLVSDRLRGKRKRERKKNVLLANKFSAST